MRLLKSGGLASVLMILGLGMHPLRLVRAQAPATPALADSVASRQKVIDAGRGIFHGGGTCFACHGPNLEGTAVAPTLRAHKWRTGDGSIPAIIGIIRNGVPNTAMVSHPGNINEEEVTRVASYVWAVSRGLVKP